MAQHERPARTHRETPGSARESKAPAASAGGALLIGIALFLLMYSVPADLKLLEKSSSMLVAGIWVFCAVVMLVVSAWASRDKRNPRNSLADLMPQRVIAGVFFGVALLSSLLLGI